MSMTPALPEISAPVTQTSPTAAARVLLYSTAAALAVRLATMMFTYQDRLDPQRGHWRFAWETGMLARSLALGKGFASPFTVDTGPSAWMGPLYPWLLSEVFRLFGLFTRGSALTILSFNCLMSALTCVPVYFIARRTVGERTARWAAWIWAFFPYAIFVATTRIWENSLTTFFLATLVWVTLLIADGRWLMAGAFSGRPSAIIHQAIAFAGYGLLWALAALCNPGVLVLLPFALAWIWRRQNRRRNSFAAAQDRLPRAWTGHPAISVLLTVLLLGAALAPWEARNYRAFHKFVPLRDNFWMEMRVGNTGDMTDVIPDWAHPAQNAGERAKFQAMGETAYLAHMRELALGFIRRYPGEFVWLTVKRFVFTWTGYWSWDPAYRKNDPFQLPNVIFCSSLTFLMLLGWRQVWRRRREWAAVYAVPLAVYPAVYYVTHQAVEYRHPIDPLMVILIAAAIVSRQSPVASLQENFKFENSP